MRILLTGGVGYIGSHTAIALAKEGHSITILDDLSNSKIYVIDQIKKISGKKINFINCDIRDTKNLQIILGQYQIDSVIHLAGLKSIPESMSTPAKYFNVNVKGTLSLIEAMEFNNIKKIIFSSSASVYGEPIYLPIDEDHPTRPNNPYAESKLNIEEALKSLALRNKDWAVAILRYFNPIGAHESLQIGEDPKNEMGNLMSEILNVAFKKSAYVNIYGGSYLTLDGTGVRDFIDIMDLAEGHCAALDFLNGHNGYNVFNLGTGEGRSVLQLIQTFEEATLIKINHKIIEARPLDVAACYTNSDKSLKFLNWSTKRTLYESCKNAWGFKKNLNKVSQ